MSGQKLIEEFVVTASGYGFYPTSDLPIKEKTTYRSIKSQRTGEVQYIIRLSGELIRLELWFGRSNPNNITGYLRLMNAEQPDGLMLEFLDSIPDERIVFQIVFASEPFLENPNRNYSELVRRLFEYCTRMCNFVETHIGRDF